jgi:hypothetical protein
VLVVIDIVSRRGRSEAALTATTLTPVRRSLAGLLAFVVLAAVSACGGEASPSVGFKPEFLPVQLNVGPDGISISGDSKIVTWLGEFSIGANYSLTARRAGEVDVILRNRTKGGIGFDDVYRVRSEGDEFTAVVNGTTTIQVRDGQVLIDITDGTIRSVQFKRSETAPAANAQTDNWWTHGVAKWNKGWRTSFYKPFMLSRWAYDDSTLKKWYGIGFVWFLVRLIVALILAIIDILMTVIFLIAQVCYWFWGPTGRNIVWGTALLLFLGLVVLTRYASS